MLVFLCSLLVVFGCSCCHEEAVQTLTQEIKKETKIDVDNAGDVVALIAGARAAGAIPGVSAQDKADAKEKADALTVVRDIKRADYEQSGDEAFDSGKYEKAARDFEAASKYTDKGFLEKIADPDSAEDKARRSTVYFKLGRAYDRQAWALTSTTAPNMSKRSELFGKAADSFITAAESASDDREKASLYGTAALNTLNKGNKAEAGNLIDRAIKLQPDNAQLTAIKRIISEH